MRCPFCKANNDQVVDSRPSPTAEVIRRRRQCITCGRRFTTYEAIEHRMPRVIKRDGSREDFDANKIARGLRSACQKLPIPSSKLEALIADIVADVEMMGVDEIRSEEIGQLVLARLKSLDPVAYVRFASVYSAFNDVQQFIDVIRNVTPAPVRKGRAKRAPRTTRGGQRA